ncbi:hypothetical protein SAMN04488065_2926 [Haloplanus vescus]|uniref:Uncharacterized protein n=1 Tax=Haloplanus vescus TaxID=555874 RepID=A0A1H4AS77_9EURY|nr:hypothetical protein [Haloplanus vescus]SEA38739.1 hypothetical protein SAMN04488065_2926 [Haloplanus vescus]
MTGTQSFAVYLTEEAYPDDGEPLQADAIDFYDSGLWVSHGGERDFFPYERVVRVREHTDDPPTGERRDAASGAAGAVDDTEINVE